MKTETDHRQLGALLRRARLKTGRSLGDVAVELNWSASKLSRIERGLLPLTLGDLDAIAGALGTTAGSLVKRAESLVA